MFVSVLLGFPFLEGASGFGGLIVKVLGEGMKSAWNQSMTLGVGKGGGAGKGFSIDGRNVQDTLE